MDKVLQLGPKRLQVSKKVSFIQSSSLMLLIERYHAPVHHAWNVIKQDSTEIGDDEALQIVIKFVEDITRS